MAKGMAGGALGDAGAEHGVSHGPLDRRGMKMVAPELTRPPLHMCARRRKYPLPRPLGRRTRRLDLERPWQPHPATTRRDVTGVPRTPARQMLLELRPTRRRQGGHPIPTPLAGPHPDLPP